MDKNLRNTIVALGWFSVALGLAELLAPSAVGKTVGIPRRTGLLRFFGLRELAAGVGILAGGSLAPWLWARALGDALDLAALLKGLASRRRQGRAAASIAAVAGVAAIDLYCARRVSGNGVSALG
jgi:hypothetical protein